MASIAVRALFYVSLSLGSLLVSANEVTQGQQLTIFGEVGVPLETKLEFGAAGGGQRVKGLQLPAGLRMAENGTVVGTPLTAGESSATAILVDGNNLVVERQELRFSVKNDTAGGRSVGSVVVASHLCASPNPASAGQPVMLTVAASESSGQALAYGWKFGDGSTQNTASGSVIHSFTAAGNYKVSLDIGNGSSVVSETTVVSVAEGGAASGRSATPKTITIKANAFEALRFSGTFDIQSRLRHRLSVREG